MISKMPPARSGRRCLPRLVGLCATLLALSLCAVNAAAAEAAGHPFLYSFDGAETPAKQLDGACGLAIDSSANLYVADYYNHAVDIFAPGQLKPYLYAGQLTKEDPLDGPCGLAIDSAGTLYINNYHRNVVRLTATELGTAPGTVIDSAHSTGVVVDPASNDVYVDDRTYVAEYEPSGQPVEAGGQPLQIGLDPSASYYGVAVSDFPATKGDVYVADAATGTVKVFDPAGALVEVIDGAGTPQAGFTDLADSSLAVDQSDGHVLVVDDLQPGFEHPAAVVDEFDPSGAYRGQITGWKTLEPPLEHSLVDAEPSGLAVGSGGNVYVTSGNDEGAGVLAFGPTAPGHLLTVAKTGAGAGTVKSEPAGIACGSACAAEYDSGARVTLTASAEPGSAFSGWSGCGIESGSECTVTMGADKTVEAEFEALPPAPLFLAGPAAASPPSAATAAETSAAALKLAKPSVRGPIATLQATVPVAGTLSISGAGLAPTAALEVPAGPSNLRLRLDRAARRALRKSKHHRLALKVTVAFRPSDYGSASVLSKTVTFETKSQEKQ